MDNLIGKQIKVSWRVKRNDGSEHDYHIRGTCMNQTDEELVLRGTDGDLFGIQISNILKIRVKDNEIKTHEYSGD